MPRRLSYPRARPSAAQTVTRTGILFSTRAARHISFLSSIKPPRKGRQADILHTFCFSFCKISSAPLTPQTVLERCSKRHLRGSTFLRPPTGFVSHAHRCLFI